MKNISEQQQNKSEPLMSPEQQERIKLAVCRFFEDKLIVLEAEAKNSPAGYVQDFYKLCTGSDQPWVRAKEFDLPGLPVPLRIRFDRSSYVDESGMMCLDVSPFLETQNVNELKKARMLFLRDVYHEAEHIFVKGDSREYGIGFEDSAEWIRYANHPGEINAFGRQFAYRYLQEYSGESFILGKMCVLAEKLEAESNDCAASNYFIVFANPEKQEKYKNIADLARIHGLIVEATKGHLEKLSKGS